MASENQSSRARFAAVPEQPESERRGCTGSCNAFQGRGPCDCQTWRPGSFVPVEKPAPSRDWALNALFIVGVLALLAIALRKAGVL